MILQAITEDVFTRYGLQAGNYKLYASAVETLFRPPMPTTLEEYGLPAPLGSPEPVHPARLASRPDRRRTYRLRSTPRVAGLSSFEEEMLRDTIDNL